MNKKLLENLYGLGSINIDITRNRVDQTQIPRDRIGRDTVSKSLNRNDPITFPPIERGIKLDARQEEIKSIFVQRKSAFVSFPPSAGKTKPIIYGLEELLNSNQFVHILFVVPRKQLAAQISDEFREDVFVKFLTKQWVANFHRDNPHVPENRIQIPDNIKLAINNQAYKYVAERTGDSQTDKININFYDNTVPLVVATYDSAAKLMATPFSRKLTHIIIDEVQELVPHPGEGINPGLIDRYGSLVELLSKSLQNTSIILMTGSINQKTVHYLSEYFNKTYKKQLLVIPRFNPDINPQPYGTSNPNHEGQLLNRSNISLQPMNILSGYPTSTIPARLNLIKNIIINKQSESVMIIFSKQKTGQGIFRMLEELIKIIPPYPSGYFYEAATGHVTHVIQNKGAGTNLDDKKNIEYLKYFDLNSVLSKTQESVDTGNIKNENNILYQSVIRGVAPLVGSMNQLHKKIIQYYFSEKKKIHMVLGTDALG